MLNILLTLAFIFTMTGLVAGLIYPDACKNKEEHQAIDAPSRQKDEAGFNIWLETRNSLERKRTTTGAVVLIAYVLTMACLIPAQHLTEAGAPEVTLITILMALISAPILIVTIRSMMHNDRIWNINLSKH